MDMKRNTSNTTTLYNWLNSEPSDSEKRELFLNMDIAMKYVHQNGYCIESFNPKKIELLNNSVDYIKFATVLQMPDDVSYQNKLIKEDIFNSSVLQILIYSKSLNYSNVDFLKNNFREYEQFLPESDVPYYRGVIERNASVYFYEYEAERVKREYSELDKQVNSKSTHINDDTIDLFGNKEFINSKIYRDINKNRNAAFINVIIYPVVITIIILMLLFVSVIINYFVV